MLVCDENKIYELSKNYSAKTERRGAGGGYDHASCDQRNAYRGRCREYHESFCTDKDEQGFLPAHKKDKNYIKKLA